MTVVYQHKFDDNPSTHPYTTAPNQLNTKLTNVSWTNSQSSWTNFAGFTGKAIATNSATPDTTRLYLNLTVNNGFMLDVKSYSFYHRSSTTGYTNYQLLVNGVLVGSGSIFVSSGTTLQSTGTINVANAIAGLTGSVTVTLKLFGGSNGNNATFRLDDFTLNGYTQEVQIYAEGYRYGYQGSEKDDESKGGGNSYTTFYRQLDPRVGRWFSIDPVFQPWQSPYCSMDGNPISLNDVLGISAGDYFDSETNEYLGSDGVDDGLEYKIKKDDFNNITKYDGYKKLSNENKKKWLTSDSRVLASKAYNHEYSKNNGCIGSSTKYNGNSEIDNTVFSTPKIKKKMNDEGARDFLDAAGDVLNVIDGISENIGAKQIPGVGPALDLVDNAFSVGEVIESEDKWKTATDIGVDVVKGGVIGSLISSGEPRAMAAGALLYIIDAGYLSNPESTVPIPAWVNESIFNNRDKDNTKVNNILTPNH